jgi:hypothetical protein
MGFLRTVANASASILSFTGLFQPTSMEVFNAVSGKATAAKAAYLASCGV